MTDAASLPHKTNKTSGIKLTMPSDLRAVSLARAEELHMSEAEFVRYALRLATGMLRHKPLPSGRALRDAAAGSVEALRFLAGQAINSAHVHVLAHELGAAREAVGYAIALATIAAESGYEGDRFAIAELHLISAGMSRAQGETVFAEEVEAVAVSELDAMADGGSEAAGSRLAALAEYLHPSTFDGADAIRRGHLR